MAPRKTKKSEEATWLSRRIKDAQKKKATKAAAVGPPHPRRKSGAKKNTGSPAPAARIPGLDHAISREETPPERLIHDIPSSWESPAFKICLKKVKKKKNFLEVIFQGDTYTENQDNHGVVCSIHTSLLLVN